MTSAISALLVFLWSLVGPFTVYHSAPPPPGSVSSQAVTICYTNGTSDIYVRPGLPPIVAVHELTHALDCIDDGALNSSLFPVPDVSGPISCPSCNSSIERQAVWVHTHPDTALTALKAWAKLRRATFGPDGGLLIGRLD